MVSRHNLVLVTLFRKTVQVFFAIDGYVRKVVMIKQASFHDTADSIKNRHRSVLGRKLRTNIFSFVSEY